MLRALHIINKVNISSRLNILLYFLKKLPILKKKLKNTNYSFLKIKGLIGIISIPYSIISTFIKSLLIFLLTMYLPTIFITGEKESMALATLIFFFYFILRLVNSYLIEYDIKKFIMVKQMKMNARDYSLAIIFPGEIIKLASKAIIFTLFLNFGEHPLYGIILAISIFSFAIFTEALHLFLLEKYDFAISRHNILLVILYFITMLLGFVLGLVFPVLDFMAISIFLNILTSPIFLVISIILGIWGSIYIYKYEDYYKVINKSNNLEYMVEVRGLAKDIHFNEVKIKEKHFKEEDLNTNKFPNKEGYDYLNAIFFDRHKRMVYKPMIRKSLIITGIFLVSTILLEFFFKDMGSEIWNGVYESFNLFVFLMYILCNSEKLIKSMFYNCDLSLLRYGFYKRGDALLKMFFLRLVRIIYSNIIPTTVLVIGLTFSIIRYSSIGFVDILPVLLLLYTLAIFFSVHYIFMYYIFQPFTTSLEVKNPFYSIINFLVYFISYMLIQVPAPPTIFLPIVTGLLVIYISMAILLVYKKAPKTFRIR